MSTFLLTRWGRATVGDIPFIGLCPGAALVVWHRLGALRIPQDVLIRSVGRATDLVLRKGLPKPARCTVLAATRVSLLRATGVRAQYASGAWNSEDGLRFHAWVELGGQRLYEPGDALYRTLFRFPVMP
jgi:hypothetical protein